MNRRKFKLCFWSTVAMLFLLAMASGGCGLYGNDNPKADLLAARQTYSSVTRSVVPFAAAGAFDEAQETAIRAASDAAIKALDDAEGEIRLAEAEGRPVNQTNVFNFFLAAASEELRKIMAVQIAGERHLEAKAAMRPKE
jgi:nitrogen fixation protein FixH